MPAQHKKESGGRGESAAAMLNSNVLLKKAPIMMALVGALVAAACVLAVMVASVGSRPAEAQPREQGQAPSGTRTNPLKYVTEDSTNNGTPRGIYKAVAECPTDHQVISGGFDIHLGGRDPRWFILDNRPSRVGPNGVGEPSNAWVVVARTVAMNPTPFTAYAVCAPESLVPSAGIQYTRGIVQVRPRNTQEITPDCQRRFKAIGGGFSLANDSLYLVRSQPNPGGQFRSWIVAASVPGGSSGGGELNAYSVCVREDLVPDKNLKFFDHAETGKGVINSGTPRCPQGTYLLSGGGGTSERDATSIGWSHIRPGGGSQADPPKDWAVGALSVDFPWVSKTVHAHAMCGTLGDRQQPEPDIGKTSGKNRGWGDGEGGGRSKEGVGVDPAQEDAATTTATTTPTTPTTGDGPFGADAAGGGGGGATEPVAADGGGSE